ncbi:MAG TPA: SMP-30/gluconolactonase/LRE family protein [Vicinamibacterales bacterium]
MVELAVDCRCELGEGPIWDDRVGRLLFVDIDGHQVHAFDPRSGAHETCDTGEYVSAVALAEAGGYAVTLQHDIAWFDFERGIRDRPISVEPERADTRFNDAYVDSRGRLWAGTLSLKKQPAQGALYLIDMHAGPQVTRMLDGVTTSNGIDWSPDERLMYYVDTGTRRIDLFDFDVATASIANRRTFVAIPESEGKPDGLIVDEDGCIWVALWQGSAVRRYTPQGALDMQIDLPVSCPTKCAFGGANLDELYITSAKTALSEAQREDEPHAGSLFVARPGVRGRAPNRFA